MSQHTHPVHQHERARHRRARVPALVTVAVTLAALALLAGCSSDDDASSTSSTAATKTTADAAENAVTITTPGMHFDVSGPLRPGVATITLRNTDKQAHMLAMAPMKPGVTVGQVTAALEQSEDAVAPLLAESPDKAVYGTPAIVGSGQSSTVTATDLPAGDYVLLCFLTDASGTPHWKMGMVGELQVKGEKFTTTPSSDGTITISDTAIALPDGFTGKGTFLVRNDATSEQSISIARLDTGTTLDAYYQHVGGAMSSNGAIDGGGGTLVGGVDALLPGQSAYLTLDLEPGHYAYLSTANAQGPEMPPQHGELDVR